MYWQSNVKKNPRGNRVFKTQFPSFFLFFFFFTWSILLLCFSWFFFCEFLSFLCLGSSCSSIGFFLLCVLSILMGTILLVLCGSFHLLFFFNFIPSFFFKFFFLFYETRAFKTQVLCGKNISMLAIDLESFRLNFFIEL